MRPLLLRLDKTDTVAVALTPLRAGQSCSLLGENRALTVIEDIPFGHKVALAAIHQGGVIRKYGECIALAGCDIEAGAHVHIHNMRHTVE